MTHDFFDPAQRAPLVERLRRLTPDAPRRWGKMTAHQTVCHLADAFRAPLGDRPLPSKSSLLQRTVIRWVAFHTRFPWPRGAPTLRELDQCRGGGSTPDAFQADLHAVERLIERFAALGDAVDGVPHPLFGPLSRREWSRWAYRHTDHHLRQFGV